MKSDRNRVIALAATVAALAFPAGGTASTPGTIAYVGCSTTTQAVAGYMRLGGNRTWTPDSYFDGRGTLGTYAGGTPRIWAFGLDHPGLLPHWTELERMAAERPQLRAIWFQVCMTGGETPMGALHNARRVMDELHRRFPGVPIMVSPMTDYLERPENLGHGPAYSVDVAAQLVHDGALPGPVMPRIRPRGLLADDTHLNRLGMRRQGAALLRHFGTSPMGLR